MNTIYSAIATNNGLSGHNSMGAVPVTVRVEVEGRMKAGEIYLLNKHYNTRLGEMK
jgi:hypothetical protein